MTDHQVARHARDETMTYVSQAPLEKTQAYKRRMGWDMPWVSAAETDFNGPGFSAFALDDGVVYQTYGTRARGVEFLMGYYGILDRAPKGRDEGDASQFWIRRHDEY
jgi:predicted dithiol-disulfide oxidoreductase (DUF899 family)